MTVKLSITAREELTISLEISLRVPRQHDLAYGRGKNSHILLTIEVKQEVAPKGVEFNAVSSGNLLGMVGIPLPFYRRLALPDVFERNGIPGGFSPINKYVIRRDRT